jgi:hypothetical protein
VTLILQYDVESVNDARNVTCWGCVRNRARQGCFGATRQLTKYCEENVYQKISATTTLQEDTERREDNGEDDLDDVAALRVSMVFRGESAGSRVYLPVKGIVNEWGSEAGFFELLRYVA